MEKFEVYALSLTIRKWDLEKKRLTLKNVYTVGEYEYTSTFEMPLSTDTEMLENYLNLLKKESGEQIRSESEDGAKFSLAVGNENFTRQRVGGHFRKILAELNNDKKKKGKHRPKGNSGAGIQPVADGGVQPGQGKMIFSTHLEIYTENQDIGHLPQNIQFFIVLNWSRKYYEKEEFQKAIFPLRRLVKLKPDYGIGYKWLARSLKKVRKYDEAVRNYENYARVENSLEARLDLAQSYRKGKMFEKSEEIYRAVLEEYPEEKEARIGLAQIKYARLEEDHLEILDELYKSDPEWMKDWMKKEFNYRIYVPPKTLLTPVQASRLLGFDKAFDLTQMAFRNEIPSHFNPSRARMNFYREELEQWAKLVNRFGLLDREIKLYPENLKDSGGTVNGKEGASENKKPEKEQPKTSRVEEIIRQIREARARREAAAGKADEEPQERSGEHSEKGPAEKKQKGRRRGRPRKSETVSGKNQKSVSGKSAAGKKEKSSGSGRRKKQSSGKGKSDKDGSGESDLPGINIPVEEVGMETEK